MDPVFDCIKRFLKDVECKTGFTGTAVIKVDFQKGQFIGAKVELDEPRLGLRRVYVEDKG